MFNGSLWLKHIWKIKSTRFIQFYTLLQSQPFLYCHPQVTRHQSGAPGYGLCRSTARPKSQRRWRAKQPESSDAQLELPTQQPRDIDQMPLGVHNATINCTCFPRERHVSQTRPAHDTMNFLGCAWKQMSRPSNVLGSTATLTMVGKGEVSINGGIPKMVYTENPMKMQALKIVAGQCGNQPWCKYKGILTTKWWCHQLRSLMTPFTPGEGRFGALTRGATV